ncbi:MAG TPA: hypothetical protein VEK57_12625 [Thermoanaerobaculia bacterium]|nr:hypothetical protein [Thermoanaerobaculia bacterium]
MTDRRNMVVRKYKLGEEPRIDPEILAMTPGERIDMVWEITKTAWCFKEPGWRESRLHRDVARVVRRRR